MLKSDAYFNRTIAIFATRLGSLVPEKLVGPLNIMNIKKKFLIIILQVFFLTTWFGVVAESTALNQKYVQDRNPESIFQGRWKTDSGSLYKYVNGAMICIAVHDDKFRGWINQVAIKNFQRRGDAWHVDQAIRYHDSGILCRWMTAKIEILSATRFLKTVMNKSGGQAECCKPQFWIKVQ